MAISEEAKEVRDLALELAHDHEDAIEIVNEVREALLSKR